jgi:hypothetical protein
MSPIQFGQRMRIRSAGYRSGKADAPTKMRDANQTYHIAASLAMNGQLNATGGL